MRIAAIIVLILAVGSGCFGFWGINSEAGRRKYDEMAGMIPYFALIAAVVLLLIGLPMLIYSISASGSGE